MTETYRHGSSGLKRAQDLIEKRKKIPVVRALKRSIVKDDMSLRPCQQINGRLAALRPLP